MTGEVVAFGSLTGTQVGYYSAVATVLPVLLLAAILQINALAVRGQRDLVKLLFGWNLHLIDDGPITRFVSWRAGIGAILIVVSVAAICLPAAAEVAAFVALSQDATSAVAKWLTEAGLVAAGLALLIPSLRALLVSKEAVTQPTAPRSESREPGQ